MEQGQVFVAIQLRPLEDLTGMPTRRGLARAVVSNGKIMNIVYKSYAHIPNEHFFKKAEQMLIDAGLDYQCQTINRNDRTFSMDFVLNDTTQFSVGLR